MSEFTRVLAAVEKTKMSILIMSGGDMIRMLHDASLCGNSANALTAGMIIIIS